MPPAILNTGTPRQLALQSPMPSLVLAIDSVKCRVSQAGLIACRDARGRTDHHSGLAAIEAIPKDSDSTLRYIALAFPALPNVLTHECSSGSFFLLCSASGVAPQIDHRRAEQPRTEVLVAGLLGLAACSLLRLYSVREGAEALRAPSLIFEQTGVPRGVTRPHCVDRKCVARAWAAEARRGRMPRGGSSAQEALRKASGGCGRVHVR